jgi:hypothetical protein
MNANKALWEKGDFTKLKSPRSCVSPGKPSGRGGSIYDLEMALTNADFRTAAREVRRIVDRPDLHPQNRNRR